MYLTNQEISDIDALYRENPRGLLLIRGVSGSGKSSLARMLDPSVYYESDNFFMRRTNNGLKYIFDGSKLGYAHGLCHNMTAQFLFHEGRAIVANTLTTEAEVERYRKLASDFGVPLYSVTTPLTLALLKAFKDKDSIEYGKLLSVAALQNKHSVTEEIIERQLQRFYTGDIGAKSLYPC